MSRNGARPRGRRGPRPPAFNREEHRMEDLLSDLEDFEKFRNDTLKAIRKDIQKGLGADEIRKKYLAILQGRLITEAVTTDDPSVALAITKDVADRVEGKAKERQEHTHRLQNLSDKELDAYLQSEEKDLEQMQENFIKQ